MAVALPPPYAAGIRHLLDGWLAALPGTSMRYRWALVVDGPVRHGVCAVVVPVRRPDGAPAALKMGLVDDDGRGEAAVPAAWDGRGAVRLLDHEILDPDPAYGVSTLLLGRLDPTGPCATSPTRPRRR